MGRMSYGGILRSSKAPAQLGLQLTAHEFSLSFKPEDSSAAGRSRKEKHGQVRE